MSNIQTKQHSKATYLSCIVPESMSGESMALKVINKIKGRLKFLHKKNKLQLKRYAGYYVILFLNLTRYERQKTNLFFFYAPLDCYLNKKQNPNYVYKYVCYYQQLDKMAAISKNEFKTLSWLPVKEGLNHSVD